LPVTGSARTGLIPTPRPGQARGTLFADGETCAETLADRLASVRDRDCHAPIVSPRAIMKNRACLRREGLRGEIGSGLVTDRGGRAVSIAVVPVLLQHVKRRETRDVCPVEIET
jgi:hypothetical protein